VTLDSLKTEKIRLPVNSLDQPDWDFIENKIKGAYERNVALVNDKPYQDRKIKLQDREWKAFIYHDIFDFKKGKRLTKSNMIAGDTPFVGSIDSNNGVSNYIDSTPIFPSGTIAVNYNGSVGEAHYQINSYWASDDCNVLYSENFNEFVGMFICTLIKSERYRFNYGRKWHLGRMKETTIHLPVSASGEPDWQFMEDYIKSLPYSSNLEKAND